MLHNTFILKKSYSTRKLVHYFEWGTKNININAIGPTVFRSPVSEWMFDEEGPGKAVRENMLDRIPIGRLGDVDDLMGGLIYLSSPASDFMTGQTIYIDGGYTAI